MTDGSTWPTSGEQPAAAPAAPPAVPPAAPLPSAQDLDVAAKENEIAKATSGHAPECGDVGETGDHGDLGENAKS